MAAKLHVLIVEARFYDDIADQLLAGAKAELDEADVTYDIVTVPGALEAPAAIGYALTGADEGGTEWMGFRPSMPDSLPVIGRSRASRDIVYAFGHGHLGLTQSAGTGRLVADLLTGREPAIDVLPFQPGRFSKSS